MSLWFQQLRKALSCRVGSSCTIADRLFFSFGSNQDLDGSGRSATGSSGPFFWTAAPENIAGSAMQSRVKKLNVKNQSPVMEAGKYIVIGGRLPVLLPLLLRHDSLGAKNVSSAGFYNLSYDDSGQINVTCEGESESLNIKSKPEADAALIHLYFFGSCSHQKMKAV
ncbi:hypothetical protein JMG10_02775 [Nostoc ellipsosporum NOK]|jgi:hypothetical protein|nr:hypothetical protein [Nostoc ellipsosporum NOK]